MNSKLKEYIHVFKPMKAFPFQLKHEDFKLKHMDSYMIVKICFFKHKMKAKIN